MGRAVSLDTTWSPSRGACPAVSPSCVRWKLGPPEKPSLAPALRGRRGQKAAREEGPAPSRAEPPFLPWDRGPHSFLGSPPADTHLGGGCWVRVAAECGTVAQMWPGPRAQADSQPLTMAERSPDQTMAMTVGAGAGRGASWPTPRDFG